MNELEGKVALVTGGNSGIGLASAKELVARGGHVFITGRRRDALEAAVTSIGRNVTAVQGDAGKLDELDRLFAQIKAEKGHLDILFANAGTVEAAPFPEVTEDTFARHFDVNVKGVFFLVQKALPLLRDRGAVILNGSVVGSKGFAGTSVYSATKAALRSFARTWTADLKGRGIRVNVVSPGPIQTPGWDGLTPDEQTRSAMKAQAISTIPLGRMGEPGEVANVVAFLASGDASFIAGTEIFVDGGSAQV
ncbi:SDR family oxidoreductase [Sorangium sp. So ce693]|uniref:SDR family oxidoreductase n=1 Tax=Sorangium sp. So ce693 TaxID=3133318 RepID=UPI003F63CF76